MNIQVRYQSRGGNTRAVAEMIARATGVEAAPLHVPLPEHTDLLFIGGGVYMWDADKELKNYLRAISSDKISRIAAFSTTGEMAVTIKRIREAAEKANIDCCQNTLCMKLFLQGHSLLGREGGQLTEEQREQIQVFVNAVLNEVTGRGAVG